MRITLFVIAALLLISWALGLFVWKAGVFIHIFFITSAIACLHAIIHTPKTRLEKPDPA